MSKVAPTAPPDTVSVSSSQKSDESVPEGEEREQWGNTIEFILSCIGYAVGLGNLTRFPYICGRNGGGAFLVPYFIMLVLCGLPVFFMELSLGQFAQVTPFYIYRRMCPLFRGLGYAMIAISTFTAGYYNIYMAWSFIYFYDTVYYTIAGIGLPYSKCTHAWNSINCFDRTEYDSCDYNSTTMVYYDGECRNSTLYNQTTLAEYKNLSKFLANGKGVSASQEYNYNVLAYKPEAEIFSDWSMPTWQLIVSSFTAWFTVFLILSKGVHSAGKVMYFTALFPYVVLTALLIVGNQMPGSEKGLDFYINPKFEKLLQAQPWVDAASQIFFSTSVAAGGLTTLSSFNQFSSNVRRDTFIVVLGNCATSIYAGFVIFPLLGFESDRSNVSVEILASGGPTLAFVAYPGALSEMNLAPVWCILFFFMLLMLGVDSEVVMVEVVITAVVDIFPVLRKTAWHKAGFTGAMCFFYFVVTLIMLTPSGPELVNMVDTFAGGWTLVIVGMLEVGMIAYLYGVRRFFGDILMMLGLPETRLGRNSLTVLNFYMLSMWCVITPVLLFAVICFLFADFTFTYNNRNYPTWGLVLGFCLSAICLIWIPLMWIVTYFQKGSRPNSWLIKPTHNWGPTDKKIRRKIALEHPVTGEYTQSLMEVMKSVPRPALDKRLQENDIYAIKLTEMKDGRAASELSQVEKHLGKF